MQQTEVNAYPCGKCRHFVERLDNFPICRKKHMGVASDMVATYKKEDGPCFKLKNHVVVLSTDKSSGFETIIKNFEYYLRLADESIDQAVDGWVYENSNEANLARAMITILEAINEKINIVERD